MNGEGQAPRTGKDVASTHGVWRRGADAVFRYREASIVIAGLLLVVYFQSSSAAFLSQSNLENLVQFTGTTAIIAAGNRILVGVLRAIQQQGVSVPGDISLIGCDRSDVALLYPGPITLIDRPVEEIGRTAAQLLLERLGGQADRPAQRIAFPTHLILGGSCLPVPKP